MFDGDASTGLIKFYEFMVKTPSITDRNIECHYTILTIEHLIFQYQLVNLKTLIAWHEQ